MRTVRTEEVITYGGSMLWYLLAVYVGGGVLALVGVVVIAMGTGQAGSGNPLALVVGLFLILVAYALMIVGTIGIAHKLIADSVRKGLENAGIAGSEQPNAPTPDLD